MKNDIENSISAVTGDTSAMETRMKAGQAEFEERMMCVGHTAKDRDDTCRTAGTGTSLRDLTPPSGF
jgi:hypothetical protein